MVWLSFKEVGVKQLGWIMGIDIWILVILQNLILLIIEIQMSNNSSKEYPNDNWYVWYMKLINCTCYYRIREYRVL